MLVGANQMDCAFVVVLLVSASVGCAGVGLLGVGVLMRVIIPMRIPIRLLLLPLLLLLLRMSMQPSPPTNWMIMSVDVGADAD